MSPEARGTAGIAGVSRGAWHRAACAFGSRSPSTPVIIAPRTPRRYSDRMNPFRVRAEHGGFQLEVPPGLCPGLPPLVLVQWDDGDDLDEEDRAALNAVLEASIGALERGETVSAEEVLAMLRERHAGEEEAEEEPRAPVLTEAERTARWGAALVTLADRYSVRIHDGRFVLLEPTDPDEELGPCRLMLDDETETLSRDELAALEAIIIRAFEAEGRGELVSETQIASDLRPFARAAREA